MKIFFKYYIAVVVFIFYCLTTVGQETNITDSLLNKLKKVESVEEKVDILITLSQYSRNSGDIENSEYYAQQVIELSKKANYQKGLGNAYLAIGWAKHYLGDYDIAQEYYVKALTIQENIEDKKGLGKTLTVMGIIAIRFGNINKALEYYERALIIKQTLKDSSGVGAVLNNIAVVYFQTEDFDKALEYMEKARKIYEAIGNKKVLGTILSNLGSYYYESGEKKKGIAYLQEALEISLEEGDPYMIAMSFVAMSVVYLDQKNYEKALDFNAHALKYAIEANAKEQIMSVYENYSTIYSEMGNYHKAYEHQKKFIHLKDSIINSEKAQQITELAEKYESEKKELKIKSLEDEKKLQQSEIRNQKIILWSAASGTSLLVLFTLLLYNRFRTTKKQKTIIENQKHIVEEKQKEITDSITYAKRLQTAILPPDNFWKKYLPQSFVLYQPKDIVSGDFYWLKNVNNLILFSAADCTGHGVSGAMVSMVCSNALNQTVKEFGITEPAKILDKTRKLVLETFEKSNEEVKDGMDISLCCLNTKTNELLWSGANNPLWYIRENNLFEMKGDKQPIGQNDNPKPFTTHSINLQKGDTVYIFTDGFADQFGGEKGKKFMYRPLKELLLSIQNKSIAEQQEILHQHFISWKGNTEQTDDVLIIGLKI